MAAPATSGSLRTSLASMQIGDYITCTYAAASGAVGTFSNLGGAVGSELAVSPVAAPNGYFYFIKADRGLLIADRVIQQSISWDTLLAAKLIQGTPWDSGDQTAVMTSNTTPSGIVTASSVYTPPTYDSWKAFNKVDDNFPWSSTVPSGWLAYDFGVPKLVTKYTIRPNNYSNASTTGPRDWTFEGWDGSNWVVLDTQFGVTGWAQGVRKTFAFANKTAYNKYRINITACNGATAVAISELEMMAVGGIMRSLTGGVAYADAYGNSTITQPSPSKGAWPANNEWDTYIIKSNLGGKITAGDDNVWHYSSVYAWCQESPVLGTWKEGSGTTSAATNLKRMCRGVPGASSWMDVNWSVSGAFANVGFRPAFQYYE